ncbi:DUF493 family protein [Helicobacter sp. MIT 14-3879]|uniref:HP0495 family protein n=1 Tax=Helicobacter sp. MIT 14-3879 TaxID=2040649 RepID=UPI000E1FA261|nr:DUF493 family protein [Helicobacter sp. MIT 14-3879]RDU62449.1 hypothetical protein CQA44_06960 [Helicobacter sp. MIT 14-3879]
MNEEIIYPIIWEYLIFTTNKDELYENIKNKFKNLEYKLEDSKKSKNEKYSSHNFTIKVINQQQRDEIFKIISKINGVKFIL